MGFRFCLAFGARQTMAPQAFLALVSSQNVATALPVSLTPKMEWAEGMPAILYLVWVLLCFVPCGDRDSCLWACADPAPAASPSLLPDPGGGQEH